MLGSKASIPLTTVSLVTLSAFLHAAFGAQPHVAPWHECFNELEYPHKNPSGRLIDVNLRELTRSFIDLAPTSFDQIVCNLFARLCFEAYTDFTLYAIMLMEKYGSGHHIWK